jgi:hypothetical protein
MLGKRKETSMLWFLMYCICSAVFLFLGAKSMSLHWFWNGLFSFFASGAIICSAHSVIETRLCHRRLAKAIKTGKNREDIKAIVEATFGTPYHRSEPLDGWEAGFFAYLPASIAVFVCLGLSIHSTAWRVMIALVSAIALAVLVGKAVNRMIARKHMLERAKKTITDHDPQMWDEIVKVWDAYINARIKANAQAVAERKKTEANTRDDVYGHPLLRCNNCGAHQREGDWEKAMDARARAMGSSRFVNLSAPEECLKCGSTDLVDSSLPKPRSEEPSKDISDLAARFSRASREWADAHSREQGGVSLSSDEFRRLMSSTRPVKERAEKEIQKLITEARTRSILNDVIRFLQRKGERETLSLIDAYL